MLSAPKITPFFQISSHKQETKEQVCAVCTNAKFADDFPHLPPTPRCSHAANTCTECMTMALTASLAQGQKSISCPECPQILSIDEAQPFLDEEDFRKYEFPGIIW